MYGRSLIAGISFVALLWTLSTRCWSARLNGPHTVLLYSRCGRTNDLNRAGSVSVSMSSNDLRITARICDAFDTAAAACSRNFRVLSTWTPRSRSASVRSSWESPMAYVWRSLTRPTCRTLHFPALKPSCHFFDQSMAALMSACSS